MSVLGEAVEVARPRGASAFEVVFVVVGLAIDAGRLMDGTCPLGLAIIWLRAPGRHTSVYACSSRGV